ncbi:MAG TPA: hypothetical protein VK550_29205 [Polyangiaceae bacterium]|nr:hypothetical protein [Polyangiaceae bacterium]
MSAEARRFVLPLAGALAIHAVVAALAVHAVRVWSPLDREGDEATRPEVIAPLEIDLFDLSPAVPVAEKTGALLVKFASVERGSDFGRGGLPVVIENRPSPPASFSDSTPNGEDNARAVDSAKGASGHESERRIDLGIAPGSWAKWGSFAASPAPFPDRGGLRQPSPVSSTGGLAEALEAYDQRAGLGLAGLVVSYVREAAGSDVAPRAGSVQFGITVTRSGVVDIAVASANGEVAAWIPVGEHIARLLRRKPPRISPHRNGVHLVIELVAKETWANGRAAQSEGPRPWVALPVPRESDQARAELVEQNRAALPPPGAPAEKRSHALLADVPGVFVRGSGRLGEVAVGVAPFAEVGHGDPPKVIARGFVAKGKFDEANLASDVTRAIATRVISETSF